MLGLLGLARCRLSLQLLSALGKLLLRRCELGLRVLERVTKDAAQEAVLTAMQLVYTGEECIIASKGAGAFGSGPLQLLHVDQRPPVGGRLWCPRAPFGPLARDAPNMNGAF